MLAVVGSKGGTGTTTTALGVAAVLREPTYVVDADRTAPTLTEICDAARSDAAGDDDSTAGGDSEIPVDRIDDASLPARLARPVPPSPTGRLDGLTLRGRTAVVPACRGRRRPGLARILRACRASPRRTIVDCPADGSRSVTRTLRIADRALVTTQPTPLAVRSARKTSRIARAVGTPVGLVCRASRLTDRSPNDAFDDPLDPPVVARVPLVEPPVFAADRLRTAHRRICATLPDGVGTTGERHPARTDEPHSADDDPADGRAARDRTPYLTDRNSNRMQ